MSQHQGGKEISKKGRGLILFIFSMWLLDPCLASPEQGQDQVSVLENLKDAAQHQTTGSRVHSTVFRVTTYPRLNDGILMIQVVTTYIKGKCYKMLVI